MDQPVAAEQSTLEMIDSIQLGDPETEKQLQQLLEGSRAAANGPDDADIGEASDEDQQDDSPLSPAGSRAMLKSRLWEQQAC